MIVINKNKIKKKVNRKVSHFWQKKTMKVINLRVSNLSAIWISKEAQAVSSEKVNYTCSYCYSECVKNKKKRRREIKGENVLKIWPEKETAMHRWKG